MYLDEFEDDPVCTCGNCGENREDMIDRVHDAMKLAHIAGLPMGSTDPAYIETIARQADIDYDDADEIIHETIRMKRPGSPERNRNPLYH